MSLIPRRRTQASLGFTSLVLVLFLASTGGQAMSQERANSFSQDVPEQTITFATVNPYTKASGSMTIVFSGIFHASRENEATAQTSQITGGQLGTFTFVPDDPSQPTVTGRFRFTLSGKTEPGTDTINFAFVMEGTTQDGSAVSFIQSERAVVSEGSLDISFGKTDPVKQSN